MKRFEVGKEYKDFHGYSHKCTKRSDKSVWFNGNRYGLNTDRNGNEYTTNIFRLVDIQASKECGGDEEATYQDKGITMDGKRLRKLYELLERMERDKDYESVAALRWAIWKLENIP